MFRASLPGRIVSLSVALALLLGGLIPILNLDAAVWVPFALLVPITGCFIGTILSIHEHLAAAAALAVALPLTFWPYTMILMLVTTTHRQFGWALLAGGMVMVALTAASGVKRSPRWEAQPAALTHG